jgi:hypothetical protein
MKKQLNTAGMINELQGASSFFPSSKPVADLPIKYETTPPSQVIEPQSKLKDIQTVIKKKEIKIDNRNNRNNESNQASELASYHASMIEDIRHSVNILGNTVSYLRLTKEEKDELSDIIYTYKRQGVKTSENEIGRVAINFLIEDYKANGQESMLAKVIERLNA